MKIDLHKNNPTKTGVILTDGEWFKGTLDI